MASLRTTSASCLGCARRTFASAARPTTTSTAAAMASATASTANPFLMIQTRGKKQYRNPDGVVVRLLEDVSRFGRKDTILRVARGRMRNKWYPDGTAEYVTGSRLHELGFKNIDDAVVPADSAFVARDKNYEAAKAAREAAAAAAAAAEARPTVTLKTVSPARAAMLLETLLPTKLEFERKTISAESQDIYGSVSSEDVATALREVLRGSQDDEEVMLIQIEARDVRFIEEAAPATEGETTQTEVAEPLDRIKSLGRWEVEITVRGSGGNDTSAASAASGAIVLRRTVVVKAQED